MINNDVDEISEKDDEIQYPDDLWYPSLMTPLTSRLGRELLSSSSCLAYNRLLSHFEGQQHSDFCGIASAIILLKRLRPNYEWHQSDLYETIAQTLMSEGMTLSQLSYVLKECGVSCAIRYCDDIEEIEDQFRQDIKEPQNFVIINYWRQYKEDENDRIQRSGHFSPVGGFHEKSDQVLIMDTDQSNFPHHWVGVKHLVKMMCATDEQENTPRGYLIVTDEILE